MSVLSSYLSCAALVSVLGLLAAPLLTQGDITNTDGGYTNEVALTDLLTFRYKLDTVNTSSSTPDALSGEMVYGGLAEYLAFGIAQDSQGEMEGSQLIISLTGQRQSRTNPGKYGMTTKGIKLMAMSHQTLMNASIVQDPTAGMTTLKFTKLLKEPNELPIIVGSDEEGGNGKGSDPNTFLWAVSFSKTLAYQNIEHGSFPVDLSSGASFTEPSDDDGGDGKDFRNVYIAHGAFGVLAWAVCSPFAAASSWLRNVFPPGRLWFKFHVGLNITCALLTIVAFLLGVTAMYMHNRALEIAGDTHHVAGWLITFVVVAQVIGGAFRPHLPVSSLQGSSSTLGSETIENGNGNSDASIDTHTKPMAFGKRPLRRFAWDVGHRIVGISLLAIGLWQIQTGLVMYYECYGGPSYLTNLFYAWIVSLGAVIIVTKIWMIIPVISKKQKDASGDDVYNPEL